MAGVKGRSGRKSKGWSEESKRLLNNLRSAINSRIKKGWEYIGPSKINMTTISEQELRAFFNSDLKLNADYLNKYFKLPASELNKQKEKIKNQKIENVQDRLSIIYDSDIKTNNVSELALYSTSKFIITNFNKKLHEIPQSFFESLNLEEEEDKELKLEILRLLGLLSGMFIKVGNSQNSKQNRADNAKSLFIDTLDFLKTNSADNKEFYEKLNNLYNAIPKDAKTKYAWLYSEEENIKIRGKVN